MPTALGKAFHQSPLFHWYKKISAPGEYLWWRLRGSPGPTVPHIIKQHTLQKFADEFDLHVLVETGTNFGHMIYIQKDRFREIYSIEIDEWKAQSARRKFENRANVHTFLGDSGVVLPKIIPAIKEPCLFWLDGHDGDLSAPIKAELDAIYKHPIQDHVLLIDDARWFDGRTDYPMLDALREGVARNYPGRVVEVKDDIIRIYKPKAPASSAA